MATSHLRPNLPLAIAAALLMAPAASAQPAAFDRSPWLQDYAAMKRALEKGYSNLAWFASPEGGVDLPALDRRTLAALQASTSAADSRAILLAFVAGFHDGHFSQLATLAPAQAQKPAKVPDPPLSRQNAADGCAARGYAVGDDTQFSMPIESMPGFHLLSDGLSQPFRAGILAGGANHPSLGFVRISVFDNGHPSLCLQAWNNDENWGPDGKFVRGPLHRAVEQLWYRSLADLLRRFQAEAVAAVIVDIGNNPGGDDSGDMMASLFSSKPVHSAPLWMAQDTAAAGSYFDEQLADLSGALKSGGPAADLVRRALDVFTSGKEKLAQDACPMDWVWRERRAWSSQPCRRLIAAGSSGGPLAELAPGAVTDPGVAHTLHWSASVQPLWGSWTGPVYVLTDHKSYSSAEMFADVMQSNRIAKIAGEQTGGDGCGFMNDVDPLVLPNSKLRFRVPTCVRMKADGTDEVAGVTPDIPILPTEGENAKQRAVRFLAALYADLASKR